MLQRSPHSHVIVVRVLVVAGAAGAALQGWLGRVGLVCKGPKERRNTARSLLSKSPSPDEAFFLYFI